MQAFHGSLVGVLKVRLSEVTAQSKP
jgi:hypothetical protein